jgi:two-component system, OmpR family, phosphate regulon sensor histidine kinase PhoR
VEALIHDLHPVAETGSTRLINTVPEDFVVYADASLIKRVLQNLIANAISYTSRGEITIGARDTGRVGEVECFVRDNGARIQPERYSKDVRRGTRRSGDLRERVGYRFYIPVYTPCET